MIDDRYRVDQGPSTNPAQIYAEITQSRFPCRSPLADYAQRIYDLGVQYGVDPAFFIGTVYGENWYGTYPGSGAWDCASQTGTYNWASITHASYGGVNDGTRWGHYLTPDDGVEAFFRLITAEYYPNGQRDLHSIWWGVGGDCDPCVDGSHAYGPCSDNHGNCSSLQTVLTVMNRIEAPPIVSEPPPDQGAPLDLGTVAGALAGLGLVAGSVALLRRGLRA